MMVYYSKKYPLIECLILSVPLLFVNCIVIYTIIENYLYNTGFNDELYSFVRYLLLIPIVNIIFYLILKKKCDLGTYVFFYGIGFTSASITLLIATSAIDILHEFLISPCVWTFYIIPLVSFFYSHALLPERNKKGMKQIILGLVIIAVAFLILGVLKDLEAFKDRSYYNVFPIFLLISLELYAGYYAIYRTSRFSSRNLAWAPALILFCCIMLLLYIIGVIQVSYLEMVLKSTVVAIAFAVIIPFIISCLIGATHKYLIKKKKSENSK